MFRTAGFVASLVAVVLFTMVPALAQQTDQMQHQGQAAAAHVTSAERQALNKAATSAQAQIEMAQLAERKSPSNEVKQLAGKIASDQQQVLSDLRNYASSNGVTLPTTVSSKDRKSIDRLSKLSDQQFDHAFLNDVQRQQTAQINVIENEMHRTSKEPFKEMANNVLPRLQQQQTEVRQQMASMGIPTAAPATDETGQPAKKQKK